MECNKSIGYFVDINQDKWTTTAIVEKLQRDGYLIDQDMGKDQMYVQKGHIYIFVCTLRTLFDAVAVVNVFILRTNFKYCLCRKDTCRTFQQSQILLYLA